MEENIVLKSLNIAPEALTALAKEVAKFLDCSESQSLVAVGTYMSEKNKVPVAQDVAIYITNLKTKKIEDFNPAEINMLVDLKHLQRKQFPFQPIRQAN